MKKLKSIITSTSTFFFFTASNNQKITWDQLLHINAPLHKKPKEKKNREKKEKKARDASAASSSNPSNQWFTKLCMLSLLRGFSVTLSGYAILSITLTVFHKAEKLRSRCGVQISSYITGPDPGMNLWRQKAHRMCLFKKKNYLKTVTLKPFLCVFSLFTFMLNISQPAELFLLYFIYLL